MRFTAGVVFGIVVVCPIASRLYKPIRPMVEEKVTAAATNVAWALAETLQESLDRFAAKINARKAAR